MKKAIMVTFILITLLTTIAFQGFIEVRGETQDIGFTIQMTTTYSNPSNGTRIWILTEEDRTIGLFMNNTWQTVYLINHSYPLKTMKVDEGGNPIAVLRFSKLILRPGENVTYTVAYRVISKPRSLPSIIEEGSETLDRIPKDLSEKYCREEGSWLANDPGLRELAHSIVKNETRVLTIVKKFITWIRNNIQYKFYDAYLYPDETYTKLQGACADQATLFITLCRIYGIPAYLQAGCIYMPTKQTNETYWDGHKTSILKRIGWHGWAIAYIPPWGWLPVDFTYVIGGLGDPLNAVKKGAVTFQETIQYMNITQTDYVASSRRARDFLQNNDFYIYMQDEMIQEATPKPPLDENKGWPRLIFVMMVAAALTGFFVIICIFHVRKRGERN